MRNKATIPLSEVPVLTDEQVMGYGNKIISMPMIPAYWHEVTGRHVDRSTPVQARMHNRIIPIGKNRGSLYFWRSDIAEYAKSAKPGRPIKIK